MTGVLWTQEVRTGRQSEHVPAVLCVVEHRRTLPGCVLTGSQTASQTPLCRANCSAVLAALPLSSIGWCLWGFRDTAKLTLPCLAHWLLQEDDELRRLVEVRNGRDKGHVVLACTRALQVAANIRCSGSVWSGLQLLVSQGRQSAAKSFTVTSTRGLTTP